LAGEGVEVVLEGLDGEGVELVEALAAGAGAADDVGALEDAEVLGDGLAGDGRAFSELGYRPPWYRPAIAVVGGIPLMRRERA
jgi:hypothetical protein